MISKVSKNGQTYIKRIKNLGFDSLHRNAYLLVGSNLLTAFSGYLFWMIAARRFSDLAIGFVSAIFSAMLLIGLISDFGFNEGLIRYLPVSPDSSAGDALINRTFSLRVLIVLAVASLFLMGINWFSPGLSPLLIRPSFLVIFILLVIINGILTLSSSVFIALRKAVYVFLSALIFNCLKIFFVIVFPTSPETLILLSSVSLAFLLTTVAILFFLMPKAKYAYQPRINLHFSGLNTFLKYSTSNQIANVLLQLPIFLLPLLVINHLGPEANARFYIAYMTAGLLRTAGLSVSQSVFAESSSDSNNLLNNVRSGIWLSLGLILFGGLAFYFLAPRILSTFGKEYSEQGTHLLRWLIISVAPFILINILLLVYRVRKSLITLIFSSLAWAMISIGSSIIGIRINGLNGFVIGWTAGQFIALAVLFLIYALHRKLIIPRIDLRLQDGWHI